LFFKKKTSAYDHPSSCPTLLFRNSHAHKKLVTKTDISHGEISRKNGDSAAASMG
jgi:hypothetical protein